MARAVRLFLLLVWLVAWAIPAAAQTGTLTAQGQCRSIDTDNKGQGTLEISGTWTGTIAWYVSNGAGRAAVNLAPPSSPGSSVTTTTSNGHWFGNVAGWRTFEVCATAPVTGTAVIWLNASNSGGGGGGGSATIEGDVMVDLGDVEELIAATNTAIGTTNSTLATIDSRVDGLEGLIGSTNSALGAVLTSADFAAAFGTAGDPDSQVLSIQGVSGMTPIVIAADGGDAIAKDESLQDILEALQALVDALSTDAEHGETAATVGPQWMCAASATAPSAVEAGDAVRAWCDLNGRLHLAIEGIEDAAETAGAPLGMVGTVRRDTPASSAGSSGDNATLNTDANGFAWTRTQDACTALNVTTVPVSATADAVLITAVSGKRNIICGGVLVAAAAEIVSLWEGTGSTCGTSSAALVGSTTEANGLSFAANGGFLIPSRIRGLTTNVDTCLRISGSNRVSGYITYVQE